MAATNEEYVIFEINPKILLVYVSYNKGWGEGNLEAEKYQSKFDGDSR